MICHFLEKDSSDIYCKAVGVNVEYIEGADINMCMSNKYKGCVILNASQQNEKIIVRLKDPINLERTLSSQRS